MAYKFQVGPARLSGSTVFEEAVSAASVTSAGALAGETLSASAGVSGASVSADGNGSFGDLTIGTDKLVVASNGVITLGGAVDETVDIAADSFYFRDADGSLRRTTLPAYATAIAGNGLAASAGSLAVVPDESSIEINADALRVKALGITNAMLAADAVDGAKLADDSVDSEHIAAGAVDFEHFAAGSVSGSALADAGIGNAKLLNNAVTLTAGAGMDTLGAVALGNSITVAVDGVLEDLDTLGTASADGEFIVATGEGAFAYESGNTARTSLGLGTGDSPTFTAASASVGFATPGSVSAGTFNGNSIAVTGITGSLNNALSSGDGIASFSYNNGDGPKTVALSSSVAGDGLAYASGVLAVGAETNGGIAVLPDGIKMDLADLTGASVDVSADSIAILDGGDSSTKLESIADLVVQMAGTGLTAASGVLNAGLDVGLKADTDTLAVGLNYMADMSADGEDTLNLPASSGLTVGDIIHVKAPSDCSSDRTVKILKNGSQTIDGLTQVIIESPFGAVSMVYVAADTFRLI